MSTDYPAGALRDLDERLAELHRAHPTAELTEAAWLMTQMLHIAVHGDTWAQPESTREVWLRLLMAVSLMAGGPSPADPSTPSRRVQRPLPNASLGQVGEGDPVTTGHHEECIEEVGDFLDRGEWFEVSCSCGWFGRDRYATRAAASEAWEIHCDNAFIESTTKGDPQ